MLNKEERVKLINEIYASLSKYKEGIDFLTYREGFLKYLQEKNGMDVKHIRIAPDIDWLYNNVFTEQDMQKCKPIEEFDFNPEGFEGMWTDTAVDKIELHAGWDRGIKDKFSPTILGNVPPSHIFGGGDTGNGKSVVVNTFIHSLAMQYPPWELAVTMVDMKMMEFGMYDRNKLPHIETISISEDIDYVVSLLFKYKEKMAKTQELFSRIGVKNLGGFYAKYNLIIPRHLIIIDEVQQAFTLAKRRLPVLEDLIGQVARLGRATGYHLFFVSQSVVGTVSADVLNQFGAGFSVFTQGANTSEALIGNDAASKKPEIDKLITNFGGGAKEANVEIRVPFLDDKEDEEGNSIFKDSIKVIQSISDKYTYKYDQFVYRQEKKTDFNLVLSKLKGINESVILLGDSTVEKGKGKSRYEKVVLSSESRSNLIMLAKSSEGAASYFRQAYLSLNSCGNAENAKNFVIVCNKNIYLRADIEKFREPEILDMSQDLYKSEALDAMSEFIQICKDVEEINAYTQGDVEEFEIEIEDEDFRERLLEKYEDDELVDNYIDNAKKLYTKYLNENGVLDFSELSKSKKYIYLVGLDNAVGLGKNNDMDWEDKIKEILEEGPRFGVHSIFIGEDIGETSECLSGFQYILTYNLEFRTLSKLGIELENTTKGFGVYRDSNLRKEFKVKNPEIEIKELALNEVNLGI